MVRGKKEDAVSELEAGRRTIVRDPDDPVQQANILDNLMISREEDIEEELRAAYMPVRAAAASAAVMGTMYADFGCNSRNMYHSGGSYNNRFILTSDSRRCLCFRQWPESYQVRY